MLRAAQNKRFTGNIYYLVADIASIPLDKETCDVIVCYSSFPHFQDKPGALTEINRVTKADGRLFICHTSSRNSINQIHRSISSVQTHLIPTQNDMERMLVAAGFSDISIADESESYLVAARKPI
jgi:demethylmenaquinone methyltransferase/2-methoxy-6-polyprenyl-1,4-benzoquinol methylase